MRKSWLTTDDVETHFMALCKIPRPIVGDPAPSVVLDPFIGTERFIREFADRENISACLNHLVAIRRHIESRGGISDAD